MTEKVNAFLLDFRFHPGSKRVSPPCHPDERSEEGAPAKYVNEVNNFVGKKGSAQPSGTWGDSSPVLHLRSGQTQNDREYRYHDAQNDRARGRNHAATPAKCVNLVLAALLASGIWGCVCAPSSRAVAVHEVVIDLALVSRETSGQLTQDALRPFILSGLRGSGHIRTVAKQQPKSRIARVRLRRVPSQSLKQQRSAAKANFGDVKLSLFLPPKGAVDKRKEGVAPGGDEQECCWGHAIIPAQQFDAHVGKSVRKAVIAAMGQVAKKQRDQPTSTRTFVEHLRRYQRGETVPQQQLRQALHVLQQRKEKQVAPLIRQLLQKEDNIQLARLFLQTLAELGDPVSIEAIIAYGHRAYGTESKVGLLDAVAAAGQLGGIEAAGWLFALSTGHSQSSVRDAAAAALVKVEDSLGKEEFTAVSQQDKKKRELTKSSVSGS